MNILVLSGKLMHLFEGYAVARQQGISIDRIYTIALRDKQHEFQQLVAWDLFGIEVEELLPYRELSSGDKAPWLNYRVSLDEPVEHLIFIKRPYYLDTYVVNWFQPKQAHLIIEGYCTRHHNDEIPKAKIPETWTSTVYCLKSLHETSNLGGEVTVIDPTEFESICVAFYDLPYVQFAIRKAKAFIEKGPYALYSVQLPESAFPQNRNPLILSAIERILEDNERLYVKLHPRSITLGKELFKEIFDLCAKYGDRVFVSGLEEDAMIPVDIVTHTSEPSAFYTINSTMCGHYIDKGVSTYLISGKGIAHQAKPLTYFNQSLDLPTVCVDVWNFVPAQQRAFISRMKDLFPENCEGRIFIYGYGKLCKLFIKLMCAFELGIEIELDGIIDEFSDLESTAGIPFYKVEDVDWNKSDSIILGTDFHSKTIRARLETISFPGRVVDLSNDLLLAQRNRFDLRSGERQVGTTLSEIRQDHTLRYEKAIEHIKRKPASFGVDAFAGVGYGSWLIAERLGCHVLGIEGSADAVSHGNQYFTHDRVFLANKIFPFSLPNEACDFVVSIESAEHVRDMNLFIQTLVQAVKPGGTVFISMPNDLSYPRPAKQTPFHYRHILFEPFLEEMGALCPELKLVTFYGQDLYKEEGGALSEDKMVVREAYKEGQILLFAFDKK
nr:methyltransferase domain-containing protein [uncultured Desulfobacter sp.]